MIVLMLISFCSAVVSVMAMTAIAMHATKIRELVATADRVARRMEDATGLGDR